MGVASAALDQSSACLATEYGGRVNCARTQLLATATRFRAHVPRTECRLDAINGTWLRVAHALETPRALRAIELRTGDNDDGIALLSVPARAAAWRPSLKLELASHRARMHIAALLALCR